MNGRNGRNGNVSAALAAAALVLAVAAPARADTEGFFFGLDLHASRLGTVEESGDAAPGSVFIDEQGGGAQLFAGWGFGPSFPVRLALTGASHETSDPDVEIAYGSLTLEAMYLFRDPEPLRPYVVGGLGGFAVRSRRDDLDFETTGPGVVLGGGLFYFFGDTFALDFAVRGEFVNWERQRAVLSTPGGDLIVETPVEEDGSAAKFLFGASWWL